MTTVIVQPIVVQSMGYSQWWCPCGITPADVVAAYQPKGAASFSDSLINLANPGTYDAIDPGGSNTPNWNATDGWVGGSGKYLKSTIYPATDQTWSMLVAFTNCQSGGKVCGSEDLSGGSQRFGISRYLTSYIQYNHGSYLYTLPDATGGIFGWAGNKPYRNGAKDGNTDITAGSPISAFSLDPIGMNSGGGTHTGYTVNVQAEVWYNKILTPGQMASVSSAMAAL